VSRLPTLGDLREDGDRVPSAGLPSPAASAAMISSRCRERAKSPLVWSPPSSMTGTIVGTEHRCTRLGVSLSR
jgi:hypothetical protein